MTERQHATGSAGSGNSARLHSHRATLNARLLLSSAVIHCLACHPQTPTNQPSPPDEPAVLPGKEPASVTDPHIVAGNLATTTEPQIQPESRSLVERPAQAQATKATPAIADASWVELPVEGFEPALLWYREQAPVLMVTHGAGGFAEWHCQRFFRIFAGKATLLCPRGKPRFTHDPAQGFYYPDHLALRREVHAVIARYEALASDSGRPYAYAGYSQGATMGALALGVDGSMFSRLLLVEGGYGDWYDALVTKFKKSGGQAVVVICGTKPCHERAHAAIPRFARAGLPFKTATAHGAGHRPDADVEQVTLEHLGFLFEGDARWADALSEVRR